MAKDKKAYKVVALIGWSAAVLGCSDPNDDIPLTMAGWADIKIGDQASDLAPYITDETLVSTYKDCTSYQILQNTPRTLSVRVDDRQNRIIRIGISNVGKAGTHLGIDLDNTIDEVRGIVGPGHAFITTENYTGSDVSRWNMGNIVIVWADAGQPGIALKQSLGMRFESYRSDPELRYIAVGEFNDNGDTVCDVR